MRSTREPYWEGSGGAGGGPAAVIGRGVAREGAVEEMHRR